MSSGSGLFLVFVSLKFPPPLLHFFSIPYQAASDRSASHGGFFWKMCICICIWIWFGFVFVCGPPLLTSCQAFKCQKRAPQWSNSHAWPLYGNFTEASSRWPALTWDLYTFSYKALDGNIFIWQKVSPLIDWGCDGLLTYWKRIFCLGVRKYTWYLLYRSQKKSKSINVHLYGMK